VLEILERHDASPVAEAADPIALEEVAEAVVTRLRYVRSCMNLDHLTPHEYSTRREG